MQASLPKAESTDERGDRDAFEPPRGWRAERSPEAGTRLVVSAPHGELAAIHVGLTEVLGERVDVLYRQRVDRKNPRPNGAPPRDHVALRVPVARAIEAFRAAPHLLYADARAELWLRGALGEQLVLDADGVIFCYPDDPSFRDRLGALRVPEGLPQTLGERDYVKAWYRAEADAEEENLLATLGFSEVAHRKA